MKAVSGTAWPNPLPCALPLCRWRACLQLFARISRGAYDALVAMDVPTDQLAASAEDAGRTDAQASDAGDGRAEARPMAEAAASSGSLRLLAPATAGPQAQAPVAPGRPPASRRGGWVRLVVVGVMEYTEGFWLYWCSDVVLALLLVAGFTACNVVTMVLLAALVAGMATR